MTKKIISLIALFCIFSCQSDLKKEAIKSGKAGEASGRINSSEQNSKDTFKELE